MFQAFIVHLITAVLFVIFKFRFRAYSSELLGLSPVTSTICWQHYNFSLLCNMEPKELNREHLNQSIKTIVIMFYNFQKKKNRIFHSAKVLHQTLHSVLNKWHTNESGPSLTHLSKLNVSLKIFGHLKTYTTILKLAD